MELQQVAILESDPIFFELPLTDEWFWVDQHRIKYRYDSYESVEKLVETAVREATEELSVMRSKKDNRPFFKRNRPNSIFIIDANQTRFLFGKIWDAGNSWYEDLSGFCLQNKRDKTLLLEFMDGQYFNDDQYSPYWE